MEKILDYLRRNKTLILLGLILVGVGSGYFWLNRPHSKPQANLNVAQVSKKNEPTKSIKDKSSELLVVDIQGAVKKAGVYRFKKGTIVQEALQKAGGVQNNADLLQINQAQRVNDQMQLYVPSIGENPKAMTPKGNASKKSNTNDVKKVININTATVDDFKNVKGVGPKKAERIIKYRDEHGSFSQVHDLTKVSGIGEKSLNKVKDQLTV